MSQAASRAACGATSSSRRRRSPAPPNRGAPGRSARARGTTPPARGPASIAERAIVSINASYLTASRTFNDSRTFDLYTEQGSFTTDYQVEARVGVDAGGFVRVWRNLAAGVAFTTHKDDRDLAIEGRLPHPLLFNHPRAIEGTAPGPAKRRPCTCRSPTSCRSETKLQVVVFGGPSFFTVKQSVVTGITFDEDYPFDEATFSGADVEPRKRTRPASTSAPTSATTSRRTSASAASSASRRRR